MGNIASRLADYERRNIAPGLMVMASEKPMQINEVVLYGSYRFRVKEEISRAEFAETLREHQKHKEEWISFTTEDTGQRLNIEKAIPIEEPNPEMTHFYRAEIIPLESRRLESNPK